MKKIGIITHYYKSVNYGGNLQAYALCKALSSMGYDAEQICFIVTKLRKDNFFKRLKRMLSRGLFRFFSNLFVHVKLKFRALIHKKRDHDVDVKYQVSLRKREAFEYFNSKMIPHSENVYYADTIQECVDNYDVFITGSDQVWNLRSYTPAYFLNFIPSGKKKISYAASVSLDSLSKHEQEIIREHIRDFSAISVREKNALDLIAPLTEKSVHFVLDPTLLISAEEWDEISTECNIDGDYVFCYFLSGQNEKSRELARMFSNEKGLKIVNIQHAGVGIHMCDVNFGDVQLFDATPQQWLSLIKNAKYVFTDSFHAVVFAQLFKTQYFVFNRDSNGYMNSRIYSICELFSTPERFCTADRENLDYLLNVPDLVFDKENQLLEDLRRSSKQFLIKSLEESD